MGSKAETAAAEIKTATLPGSRFNSTGVSAPIENIS